MLTRSTLNKKYHTLPEVAQALLGDIDGLSDITLEDTRAAQDFFDIWKLFVEEVDRFEQRLTEMGVELKEQNF